MLKNNRGFTLVELLAVLALMSIIIVLVSSAHLFGQKQFTNQAEEVQNQADARFIVNQVSKDVRKAGSLEVTGSNLTMGSIHYQHAGTTLTKNGAVIAENIKKFEPEILPEDKGKGIKLVVSSLENRQGESTTLETIIYVRE